MDHKALEPDPNDDYAEQDGYTVEKILVQRPNGSAPEGVEFKVRWRGFWPSHDTWEPVYSFVPRINTPFMEYVRKQKTKVQVSDLGVKPWATDHRPYRSPQRADGARVCQVVRTSLACLLSPSSGAMSFQWSG